MKRFQLKYKDEQMEKEYLLLQRNTSNAENIRSSSYFLMLLLIIPGVPAFIGEHYLEGGLSLSTVLVVVILYFWKVIPKIHVQLLVALVISSFNHLMFFLPFDCLNSLAKNTVFFRGYAYATINVTLLSRFTCLWQKILFLVYSYALRVTVMVYLDTPHTDIFSIVRNFYIDLFVIYTNFTAEKKNRMIFKSFYDYREELMKFKQLLSEYFPQSILIFENSKMKLLFQNRAFLDTFCQHNEETHSSENKELIKDNKMSPTLSGSKLDLRSLKVEKGTIREVGTVTASAKILDAPVYLQDVISQLIKDGILDQKSICLSTSHDLDNDSKIFEVILTKIKWDGEDSTAVILNDITYQEKLIGLKISDTNKDQIIATVSHELRTPLNGIIGILGIVEKKINNEKIIEYIELCKDNAHLLLGLVNSLLDLHQVRQGKLQLNVARVNLKRVLSEVIRLFIFQSNNKGLYLKLDISEKVPDYIYTDENRLKQILINLIGNAMKFTIKGGITVEVNKDPKDSSFLEISVVDTGIGIKEEDKAKLFQMYEKIEHGRSVNKNGVGLGLTISNTLACLLSEKNGERAIAVESSVDSGSRFSFKISKSLNTEPKKALKSINDIDNQELSILTDQEEFKTFKDGADSSLQNQKCLSRVIEEHNFTKRSSFERLGSSKNLPKPRPLEDFSTKIAPSHFSSPKLNNSSVDKLKRNHTLLVVDDNAFNLLVAKNILNEIGFSFKGAGSGLEAIEIIKSTPKELNLFKAILMDCQMPVMDGFETTRILREMMEQGDIPKIPIIALTANNGEEDIKECYASGMINHLSKPLFADALLKVLEP